MRPDRAWVRLSPERRLNLLDLRPDAWTDEDLATGLSRTYRWRIASTVRLCWATESGSSHRECPPQR